MIETFRFSTVGLPVEKAIAGYRDLYAPGADVLSSDLEFSAQVIAHRLDRLILFNRTLSGVSHARAAPRVTSNRFSHFVVHLVIDGELLGSEDSRFARAGPGDVVLQDLRLPSGNSVAAGHIITVSTARDLIEAAAGTANGLHGRVLPASQSGLFGDHLRSVAGRVEDLTQDALPTLSRTFVNLLGLSIAPTGGGQGVLRRMMEFDRRESVQRAISAALDSADLNAGSIARMTNISRATLYRLLKPYGGVERFVLTQRLSAVRAILARKGDVTPMAELAARYQFRGEDDMRSRFRERFGLTPLAWRRMVDDPGRELEAIKRQWASWMTEVQ